MVHQRYFTVLINEWSELYARAFKRSNRWKNYSRPILRSDIGAAKKNLSFCFRPFLKIFIKMCISIVYQNEEFNRRRTSVTLFLTSHQSSLIIHSPRQVWGSDACRCWRLLLPVATRRCPVARRPTPGCDRSTRRYSQAFCRASASFCASPCITLHHTVKQFGQVRYHLNKFVSIGLNVDLICKARLRIQCRPIWLNPLTLRHVLWSDIFQVPPKMSAHDNAD